MNHQMDAFVKDATPASSGVASVAVKRRLVLRLAVLLLYMGCVLYITLFARTVSLTRSVDTALFAAWRKWLAGDGVTGRSVVENIVLFVPLGYLLAWTLSADGRTRAALTVLLGGAFSLGIEVVQFFTGRGWADVDDLFNNLLGTVLGLLLQLLVSALLDQKKAVGRVVLSGVLPTVMLAAGLVGCWLMRDMVVMTNLHTDQFGFYVDEVEEGRFSGRCLIYDRDTPSYRLYLVRGTEAREVEVSRQGESFTAQAGPTDGKYEVRVRFQGYPTLPTGVYLNGTRVEYVEEDVKEPVGADGQPLVADGVLKAWSQEWDCYVYQWGRELRWLIGPKVPPTAELIYHLQTNRPELLPKQRVEYGFDNLGFFASQAQPSPVESYRFYTCPIPEDYPVTSITVGLNLGDGVIWRSAFRP